jgi:hypothetical protein
MFVGNSIVLAAYSGYGWLFALVLQGFLIQTFGYVVHDLFIHRRIGGRASYYIGVLFEVPITFRFTWHALITSTTIGR